MTFAVALQVSFSKELVEDDAGDGSEKKRDDSQDRAEVMLPGFDEPQTVFMIGSDFAQAGERDAQAFQVDINLSE